MTIDVDEAGYRKFQEAMKGEFIDDYDQWNVFFNTEDASLLKNGKRARVRYIVPQVGKPKYTICVKTAETSDRIDGGVARRREIEEDVEKETLDAIMRCPADYYRLAPAKIKAELEEFKDKKFVFLVDFRSQRRMYKLGEFVIEADECTLPNGEKFFQIELESDEPERAKAALEAKLREIGAEFHEAPFGKFKRLVGIPADQRLSERLRAVIETGKVE